MGDLSKEGAIKAYRALDAMQKSKREITKDEKPYKEYVSDYLDEHPEGFHLSLEDGKGKTRMYHIARVDSQQAKLDRDGIREKLISLFAERGSSEEVPEFLTSAYLAHMVEAGNLTAIEIEGYEEVSATSPIKKTKFKGALPVGTSDLALTGIKSAEIQSSKMTFTFDDPKLKSTGKVIPEIVSYNDGFSGIQLTDGGV